MGRFGGVCGAVLALSMLTVGCTAEPEAGGDPVAFASAFTDANDAYQAEMDEVQARGRDAVATDPKAVAAVFEELIGVIERSRERYERLAPPAEVQAPHDDLLDNLRRQEAALGRVVDSTRRNEPDPAAIQELAGLLAEFASTQQLLAERLAADG